MVKMSDSDWIYLSEASHGFFFQAGTFMVTSATTTKEFNEAAVF